MTVLITGSSKGLGKSLALVFSKNNYNIILHGRDKKALEDVKKLVIANNVECDIVIGDLTDIKTIEDLSKVAKEKDISILINNAGILSKGSVEDLKDEEIDKVLEVNLGSVIKLTRRIYNHFLKKKSGMIINIISTAGYNPDEELSIYTISFTWTDLQPTRLKIILDTSSGSIVLL